MEKEVSLLPQKSAHRVSDAALASVMLTIFLDGLADSILTPMLALYAKTSFNATDAQVGYLFSVSGLTALLFSPVLAVLSNSIGRKAVFVISLLGMFIAAGVQGFALTFGMLACGRALGGLWQGTATTAKVYINEATEWDKKGDATLEWNSWFVLAQQSAKLFGPALGGALAHYGFNVPSFATMVVELVGSLIAFLYIEESPKFVEQKKARSAAPSAQPSRQVKSKDPQWRLLLWCCATMLTNGCVRLTESTFALFGLAKYSFGPTDIGFIFLLGALASIVASRWTKIVKDKLGLQKASVLCCLLYAAATAAFPFMPAAPIDSDLSVWELRIWYIPITLCFMIASGASVLAITMINSLATIHYGFHDQPTIQARGFMFRAVGKMVMPIAGSNLMSLGLVWPWLFGAAVAAASAPVCYILAKPISVTPTSAPSTKFGDEWTDEELTPEQKRELGEFMAEMLKRKHLRWATMRSKVELLLENEIHEMPIESKSAYHERLNALIGLHD